jgi:hypothetical protein
LSARLGFAIAVGSSVVYGFTTSNLITEVLPNGERTMREIAAEAFQPWDWNEAAGIPQALRPEWITRQTWNAKLVPFDDRHDIVGIGYPIMAERRYRFRYALVELGRGQLNLSGLTDIELFPSTSGSVFGIVELLDGGVNLIRYSRGAHGADGAKCSTAADPIARSCHTRALRIPIGCIASGVPHRPAVSQAPSTDDSRRTGDPGASLIPVHSLAQAGTKMPPTPRTQQWRASPGGVAAFTAIIHDNQPRRSAASAELLRFRGTGLPAAARPAASIRPMRPQTAALGFTQQCSPGRSPGIRG